MSGIRIPMIAQIISLAIKKGVNDLSPLVRKAAALACVKCVQLDESTRPQIEDYISTLLGDQQYYVAGAAVQAFMEVCPDRLDLIHPVYRRLCKMIVDMDEWGQLAVIRLFTVYSRKCFPKRTTRVKRAATQEQRAKDFYEDLEPQEETEDDYEEVEAIDPDLELFLKSIQPLLSSRNSAVILAVTRTYLYLALRTASRLVLKRRFPESRRSLLQSARVQCWKRPVSVLGSRHALPSASHSSHSGNVDKLSQRAGPSERALRRSHQHSS